MAKLTLVLALLLASCGFATKHPAVTAGIVTGTIGLVACLPAVEQPTKCLAVGAIAGVAIGGITGLVTLFVDTDAHELPPFEEEDPDIVRVRTRTAPPPVPIDAGVPEQVPADAGAPQQPAPATGADAGVSLSSLDAGTGPAAPR